MDRRDFLRTTGGLLASAALHARYAAAEEPSPAPAPAGGRQILPMNRSWRWAPGKLDAAAAPGFDDAHFSRVVLPHSNVRMPWHSFDDKDYEFVSTYRRRFRLPVTARGKRVFVDFEGAMTASTVWINGVSLGEYKGGYTPFSFELTPHLRLDGENVLCVQLDSTERADIPPFGKRSFAMATRLLRTGGSRFRKAQRNPAQPCLDRFRRRCMRAMRPRPIPHGTRSR